MASKGEASRREPAKNGTQRPPPPRPGATADHEHASGPSHGAEASPRTAKPTPTPFKPTTGEWLKPPVPPAANQASASAGPRKGVLAKAMWVLVWVDVLAIGALLLSNIYAGAVLLFNPESGQAERLRQEMDNASAGDTYLNVALSFLLFGVIPLAWLLATRRPSWRGAGQYLQFRAERRDWLRGIALVPILVIAVAILSALYVVATQGLDAFEEESGQGPANPLFNHLTWPLVAFITLASGIGEELFFRGILRRWIGIWPQAIAFGLAHAAGAFPPQIIFAFALGVLFGYLMRRGWSIVTMMVAHAGYNLTLLSLAMLVPELA